MLFLLFFLWFTPPKGLKMIDFGSLFLQPIHKQQVQLIQDLNPSQMFTKPSPQRKQKSKIQSTQPSCDYHSGSFTQRRKYIESFTVFHPLLDRLLEIKMAKCFQHGHIRQYQTQIPGQIRSSKKIEAPSIQGSIKVFSLRPKTSQIRINLSQNKGRPRTTNTVIRSRTSQPRIQRKLELISKQPTQFQEEELKPSLMINRLRRSSAQSTV